MAEIVVGSSTFADIYLVNEICWATFTSKQTVSLAQWRLFCNILLQKRRWKSNFCDKDKIFAAPSLLIEVFATTSCAYSLIS
jgi:hypothetical protein